MTREDAGRCVFKTKAQHHRMAGILKCGAVDDDAGGYDALLMVTDVLMMVMMMVMVLVMILFLMVVMIMLMMIRRVMVVMVRSPPLCQLAEF